MVQPNDILESLTAACKRHGDIPSAVTYSTVVLDGAGEHSNVAPPIIEFSVEELDRVESRNSEKWGIETDDDGTEVGYYFTQWFDLTVAVEVFTVTGTPLNHRDLEQALRRALYRYDSYGIGDPLPHPTREDEPLRDICWLIVQETHPNHDFGQSPSVRARTITLDIGFTHEIRTTDLGIEYDTLEEADIGVELVDDLALELTVDADA